MIPILVISLAEAKDRRLRMEHILAGKNFSFIEAVDGRQFNVCRQPIYDSTKRLFSYGKHLNGGEIGCLLSHKKAYQHMVDNAMSYAFIFEDDVILRENFWDICEKILSSPVSYDMVRFFGSPKLERLKMRSVYPLTDTHYLARHTGLPGGAHATLMTLSGAKKMLQALDKTPYPIDTLLGRSWKTGCNWYTVRPGIAAQDLSFTSSIGEERFDGKKDIRRSTKILYPFTRGWFKLSETLAKKYWYIKTYRIDKKYADHR